jgi:hypothetical protein
MYVTNLQGCISAVCQAGSNAKREMSVLLNPVPEKAWTIKTTTLMEIITRITVGIRI